jgi:peptide/nickel transport system substrate-binding protein
VVKGLRTWGWGGWSGAGRGFLAIAIAVSLLLGGCAQWIAPPPEAAIPSLVTSVLSDPKTFNAALNNESPNIFTYTYEGLTTVNGETAEVEPALAESWTVEDGGLRVVFTLREGLRWSDGAPLTARDVDFTYNQIYFNDAIVTSTRDVMRIGQGQRLPTVRAIDDRRIEFRLPEPFAPFLQTTGAEILPEHALRRAVETQNAEGQPLFLSTWGVDTDPSEIVFNGPYVLERYSTSERVVFRRNPYYWRTAVSGGDPRPKIDRFIWQIVESQDTTLLKFRSRELDLMGVSPDYFTLLKREEERGEFTIYEAGPALSTSWISFNLNQGKRDGQPLVDPKKSAWFNNVKFRQAVSYAINRQGMIDTIYRGLGEPQISPISVQSPFYVGEEAGVRTYPLNRDRARQLLQEAGFQYRGSDLVDWDGNPVRFTMMTNAGAKIREAMGSQIMQDLAAIGIKVDFQPIAFNTLIEKLDVTLDWDCMLLGLTGGTEPNNGANVWLVDGRLHAFNQAPPPNRPPLEGRTIADWEQRISDLYVEGAKELDPAKRKAIYAETQRLTQEYLPFIYLVNPLSMSAVRDRVQGLRYSALGGALWNIHELELTAEDT